MEQTRAYKIRQNKDLIYSLKEKVSAFETKVDRGRSLKTEEQSGYSEIQSIAVG